MALSFGRETPVLQLSRPPRVHFAAVLLPVWVHAVTSPLARSGGLDVFQRTMLALSQAGIRDVEEICTLMRLDAALVKTIADRLVEQGLLARGRVITKAGAEALAKGSVEDGEPRFLRCFQSPETEQLLPRILVAEPLRADARRRYQRRVEIEFGTAGKPQLSKALILRDPRRTARRPSDRDVIEACRRHDAATRGRPSEAVPLSSAGQRGGVSARLGPVRFHGEPTSAYLVCFLREGDDGMGRGWQALDPFAVGETTAFTQSIADAEGKDSELSELITKLTRRSRQAGGHAMRAAEQQATQQIRADLVRIFGEQVKGDGELFAKLVAVDRDIARNNPSAREDVAREVIRLFEYLLPLVAHRFPSDRPQQASSVERVRDREFVVMANNLGVLVVPEYFRQAARSLGRGLGTDVVRAVQAAAHNPNHPLRALASARPTFLADLDHARVLRNRATHARTDAPPAESMEQLRALAHDTARHLAIDVM